MIKVECVLNARARIGECPVWSVAEQALYWIDIPAARLHRFDPASGLDRGWALPAPVGALALRRTGSLLLALKGGLFGFDPATAQLTPLAPVEADLPANRPNDGRCDRAGRFWFGTMRDPNPGAESAGALYRFAGGAPEAMTHGFITPNGLAFSPDDRTIYFAETNAAVRTIWAADYDLAAGTFANRRVFLDTSGLRGRPDGAAVDEAGCYWMAATDGFCLYRITPQGKVDMIIDLPVKKPTMPCFGGPGLDTIYVTSIRPPGDLSDQPQAGGVFAIRCGIKGLAEPAFGF